MLRSCLFALMLTSLTFSAHATESAAYFKFSELLESDATKDILDPEVKLYFGTQPVLDFAEVARPDSYTRSSISISPLGGSRRHCVEAFQKSLAAMIGDARARG